MTNRPTLRNTTSVRAMLNTLEHERYARGAVLVAFLQDLRAELTESAPESTRELLARAERGELDEVEVGVLLEEIRALLDADRAA